MQLPDSLECTRDFDKMDDGIWCKTCTWCQQNMDRQLELLTEEIASHGDQVRACAKCKEIKLRADFNVQTTAGFTVRSCCVVCRPLVTAQWKKRRQTNLQQKKQDKDSTLDEHGCASYGEKYDKNFPCPFGFDKNNVAF